MNIIRFISFIFILIIFSLKSAQAYDRTGHRIICKIAQDNLNDKALRAVNSLLGTNGIVNFCNWADDMRDNPDYKWTYNLHFKNLDDGLTTAHLDSIFARSSNDPGNLLFAIDSLTKRLHQFSNDTIALKFLIHLIGDFYQPLHFGRFSDLGGNKIKIKWFNDTITLHSLWDKSIVEMEQLGYSEYSLFLQDINSKPQKEYSKCDLLYGFKEGYRVRSEIYAYNYSLLNPYKYYYKFNEDLHRMLYIGGIQLSKLLNSIYG